VAAATEQVVDVHHGQNDVLLIPDNLRIYIHTHIYIYIEGDDR